MAYKVFQNGFPLNASELNNYLMNQSVMVFASATARDTDLTAPLEGMIVWLQDSNKFVYYTGSEWSDVIPSTGSGNAIINGAFDIWQRGTSLSAADAFRFLADRWGMGTVTSTIAPSQQTFTPGTAPVAGYEAAYYHRAVVASANTSGSLAYLYNKIEDVRSFAGQTVTLSFWAKADASKNVAIETVQDFGSGGSTYTTAATKIAITSSWTRYSYTFTAPSISGKTIGSGSHLGIYFWFDAGSSWNSRTSSLGNQSGTFDIWGVQLEAGSTATAFKRNASNIQGELAACQRYYIRYNAGSSGYGKVAQGFALGSNSVAFGFPVPVEMRTVASSVDYSTIANWRAYDNVSEKTGSSFSLDTASTTKFINVELVGVGSATTSRPYFLRAFNDTAAYIGFSAEL